MLRPDPIAILMPRDAGLLSHCRRVAALAQAVAHHLFLPTAEKDLLRQACLLHHYDLPLLAGAAARRLLADILGAPAAAAGDPAVALPIRAVLHAWQCPGSGSATTRRLAAMLRLADAFDQEYEAAALEAAEPTAVLSRLRSGVDAGLWDADSLDALQQATLPVVIPSPANLRVPTFPLAATRILGLLRNPRASTRDIETAAGTDPAIAGKVMQLANSALYGSRGQVTALRDAVLRLGFETARKVILSLSLRAVLAGPKLQSLWPHSLAAADLGVQLAERCGSVDPDEAYLCGLLHDVGRIAIAAAPLYDSARLEGFMEGGCPPVYAENLLLGVDHGVIGAEIARIWKLPLEMVEAIRFHHRPESGGGPLAALLYLTEHAAETTEDLPSHFRLETALRTLSLQPGDVEICEPSAVSLWLAA